MQKCGNHGDDSGIKCSDDIHNTYWMACADNKLVGCSWICPLFAYSCHANILIIINFKLFLFLGAMIIFDAIITSIVAIIMNYHINNFDTCTPFNCH